MDIDRSRFRAGRGGNSGRTSKDWLDWLNNDPPSAAARQELRQKRLEQANRYQPRSIVPPPAESQPPAGPPNVTININLPKFSLPKVKTPKPPKLPAPPYRRLAIAAAALVLLAGGGWWGLSHKSASKAADTTEVAGEAVRSSPSFIPIAPKDKPQLGKFAPQVTAYDGHHDTYSYVDLLPGGHITVSEQPMPSNLGPSDKAVATIASRAGATSQFKTDKGVAYMRTDPKNGSQFIVSSVDNLLIFINSPYGHNTATWQSYLESL